MESQSSQTDLKSNYSPVNGSIQGSTQAMIDTQVPGAVDNLQPTLGATNDTSANISDTKEFNQKKVGVIIGKSILSSSRWWGLLELTGENNIRLSRLTSKNGTVRDVLFETNVNQLSTLLIKQSYLYFAYGNKNYRLDFNGKMGYINWLGIYGNTTGGKAGPVAQQYLGLTWWSDKLKSSGLTVAYSKSLLLW
jgi:hypothetical protein